MIRSMVRQFTVICLLMSAGYGIMAWLLSPGTLAQENGDSATASTGDKANPELPPTPAWWLEAVEEMSYPQNLSLQTKACANRLEAEAELDRAIAEAATVFFSNYLENARLKEIVGAIEFLKKNAVVPGHYEVLAVRSASAPVADQDLTKQPPLQYQGFAHVKFSEELWRLRLLRNRLVLASIMSWTVICGLLVFSIFLRINRATRGMYQGRLQLASIIAFLVLATAGLWISRIIV